MKVLLRIIKKEFLQFIRDPKMFRIVLIAPVVQLVLLGYAANLEVKVIHTAVFNQSGGTSSKKLLRELKATGYFHLDYYVTDYKKMQSLIDNGKVVLGIVFPKNFDSNIRVARTATIQAVFDASDGNTATISAGYLQAAIEKFSRNLALVTAQKRGGNIRLIANINPVTRVWFNPELKTRVFMVPGIMSLLLMIITLTLTSLAIVKEKEIGTFDQLIVTPIKPYQLILGKFIPFVAVGFVVILIVLTAMAVVFNIIVKGSILFLFLSSFIFVLSTLGLGLFISTLTKTQQQAMMIATFGVMMPMIYLSGFAFPIENMPQSIQYITYLIPLRYFIQIIRGVILKGLGFSQLWPQFVILIFFGIFILFLSSLRFKKKID